MTKRGASYNIDPTSYEQVEKEEGGSSLIDLQGSHMKGRVIHKIKRDQEAVRSSTQSRPSLNIPGLALSNPLKDEKQGQSKQSDEKQLFHSSRAPVFKSLFANIPKIQNPFTNFFQIPQEQNSKETKNESTLNFSGSIFGKDKEKPNQTVFGQVKGSVFGSGTSLFGNGSKPFDFGNGPKPFDFGKMPILSQNSNLPKNMKNTEKGDGEDGDDDSAQLQKNQSMEVDPTKSKVKYEYKQQFKILKVVSLSKYKVDQGQMIDTSHKALLLYNPQGNTCHLLIRSPTHAERFSGIILPNKSEFKTLHGKSENLEIRCFKIDKETKKLQSHIVKIQILKEHDSVVQEFSDLLNRICEGKFEYKEKTDAVEKDTAREVDKSVEKERLQKE